MSGIQNASIQQIHSLYSNNKLTVRSLVMSYLSRIAKIDRGAHGLNSVLELNPDALYWADKLDEEMKKYEKLPPLFGIPILVKDNINSADKLHTSAGSLALAHNYAPYDAHVVNCLRKAGAIILGKANMTEFANFMSDGKMPNGYSSRGGQVINPFNTAKSPMGSSSGSAVAVAAGLCTVALGTETSGSIISPAWQNGVVGIKPTLGLVGRSGIIPICYAFDTAGPITRNVQDAAILLTVISETDPDDVSTHAKRSDAIDYTQYLDENGLNGLRLGICRNQEETEEKKIAFDNLLKILSRAGAILVDINFEYKYTMWNITKSEFQPSMNYYLSTLRESNQIKSLRDIMDYNEANAEKALKYGQKTFTYILDESSGNLTEADYIEELINRDRIISEFDDLFIQNKLDVILTEKNMGVAPYAGFPSMTVPIGQESDKLPIGSYWIARRYDEASLFRATYAVEQLLNLNLVPELEQTNQ